MNYYIKHPVYSIKRYFAKTHRDLHPGIMVNSFPKSGTHLLYQLVQSLPNINDYKYFLASMPSVSQNEYSVNRTLKMIDDINSAEVLRAHLFYNGLYEESIINNGIVHYFIYRDPRDVVISEAHYLFDMTKWHRLHKYFKKFSSLDDRIMFSIQGNEFYKTPVEYPNVVMRFKRYKDWLSSNNVYSVKYEDLVGKKRDVEIEKIMHYYIQKSNQDLNVDEMITKAISNIDPTKSHTFREGGTQKWKKYFNDEHSKVFKIVGGELLIELGYEEDLNW